MRYFIAAIRFLTVLPLPGNYGASERDFAGSAPFFPLVGLLMGMLAAGVAFFTSMAFPPLVSAAVVLVLLMIFSGGLHMEGVSDTADGFLSSRPKEKILEIMKDSRAGPMGIIVVTSVLILKFSALSSVLESDLWRVAFLMPLAGRCAIIIHMSLLKYARPSGLGSSICRKRPWITAIWSTLLLAAAGWQLFGAAGLLTVGICLTAVLLLALYFYRRLGGATGDTFGAACEIAETMTALSLAVMFW